MSKFDVKEHQKNNTPTFHLSVDTYYVEDGLGWVSVLEQGSVRVEGEVAPTYQGSIECVLRKYLERIAP